MKNFSSLFANSRPVTIFIAAALVLIAPLAFGNAWACSSDDTAIAEQSYSTAYQFVQAKQWAEAIPSLESAMEACPDHWVSQELLGMAYMRIKDYPASAASYEKLMKGKFNGVYNSADLRTLQPYSFVLIKAKQLAKAELVLEGILVQDPLNIDAHKRLWQKHKMTGAREKVLVQLEKLFDITSGKDKSAWANRIGDTYKKAGDQAMAQEWYTKSGGASKGLFDIGLQHMGRKEWAKGAIAFQSYVDNSQKSVAGWKNLGQCLQKQKKNNEAITAYKTVLSLDPERHDVVRSLGFLYEETSQWQKAGALAEKAVANWPANDEAKGAMYYLMGKVYEKRDSDFEKAITMFEKAKSDSYWGDFATKEITRQNQLIQIREMEQKRKG